MDVIDRIRSAALWTARVLWACRVSVVSAAAGLVLFGRVVQAQNLMADTSWDSSALIALAYWAAFYTAVILAWAFPVHYGARRTLEDPSWIIPLRVRAAMTEADAEALCRRVAIEHAALIRWVPRMLGMLPFVAIALGLRGAGDAVSGAGPLNEAKEAVRLLHLLWVGDALAGLAFLAFVVRRRDLAAYIRWRLDRVGPAGRPGRGAGVLAAAATACLWLTVAMFAAAYASPVWLSAWVPRALMVPALLGSLVLPLCWVARKANAQGVPWLLLLLLGCLLATGSNRRFHDLRTIPREHAAAAVPPTPLQLGLADAAERWRRANGCAGEAAGSCPRALIVAAEGGASRAAFMTATAVGSVLDRMQELGDGPALSSPGRRIFAISGVSGGALGAALVRAALADAQAHSGPGQEQRPPCLRAPRSWFRAERAWREPDMVRANWRYCLQALASGDFLSAAFVGLAFRDVLAPPLPGLRGQDRLDDRAALLEEAWERHYDSVTRGDGGRWSIGEACAEVTGKGLCRRFGYAGALEAGTSWVPLLLLNGTSVQTGRRVIVSDLASTADDGRGGRPASIYPEAYDLFEAMGTVRCPRDRAQAPSRTHCEVGPAREAPDLRLSTAALASARFPIISPAGSFRPANSEAYGDRVVDGGYFENAGLTTATDLAEALRRIGIECLILRVSNEPQRAYADVVEPSRADRTPGLGPAEDASLPVRALGLVGAPLQTIYDTREGHGAEAAWHAGAEGKAVFSVGVKARLTLTRDLNRPETVRCRDFVGESVEMTTVSMSWWLSPAVQADLDAQVCDDGNQTALSALMTLLESPRARDAAGAGIPP